METLSEYVEWIPVCPEVELGLGTPRETIQLVQLGEGIRLRTSRTHVELTKRMQDYSKRRVAELVDEDLDGYILKKDSPSCGMERVKVHQEKGGSPPRKAEACLLKYCWSGCPICLWKKKGGAVTHD